MSTSKKKEMQEELNWIKQIVASQQEDVKEIDLPEDTSLITNTSDNFVDDSLFAGTGIFTDNDDYLPIPQRTTPSPGRRQHIPPEELGEEELTFDLFPDICKDEISVNSIQHDEVSLAKERKAYDEDVKRSEESAKKLNGSKKLPAGFIFSLVGIILLPFAFIGLIFSIKDKKDHKKLSVLGIVLSILSIICWVAVIFFVAIKFFMW